MGYIKRMTDISASSDSALPPAFPPSGHSAAESSGPLISGELDDSFSETRRLRADGWTTFARRVFLDLLAARGSVTNACRAAGLSAQSAYELRNRDPLFATAWDAALVLARRRLADDLLERALGGCIEQIHRDGVIVAERHRYDNKLSIAVLTRLDRRLDRAQERGEAHLRAAADWDAFSGAVAEQRGADAFALIAPPPETGMHHQLHQLNDDNREISANLENEPEDEEDYHQGVWQEEDGAWLTDYPPPPGFAGQHYGGIYGDKHYQRECTPGEIAVAAADVADDLAEQRAKAERMRDDYFGFTPEASEQEERSQGEPTPPE